MPNYGAGASGAASGAAQGAALGSIVPGVGTAVGGVIGGAIGGIRGLFKRKRKKQDGLARQQASMTQLKNLLNNEFQRTSTDPRSTALYNSGQGTLKEMLRDSRRRDAGVAASRGLAGSEFEIAQAANRQKQQSSFLRDLLASAEGAQRQERSGALGRLMQAQGMENQMALAREQMRRADQQASNANAFGALNSLANLYINKQKG